MTLWILAYLAGALTILSPCILPVLPFVFARSDEPFGRSGLPLLAGMAVTFAGVATIAVAGGAWAAQANQYGRIVALALLALFALTLLSPRFAEKLLHPFAALGGRLAQTSGAAGPGRSFLLGVATGLLWAPCAGPILGLVLTGAALSGASAKTSVLLLVYALGAATSLALALAAGGRLLGTLKRYLGADVWVRRGLGIAVLCGVAVIAFGWDRSLLTRISAASTATLEQRLINMLHAPALATTKEQAMLADEGPLPALDGAVAWLNSPPLTREALRGRVVLIDFWTYSCINCLRTLPYVKAWAEKYRDAGLVAIGVHAPEFAFEKDLGNVTNAVRELGIAYPVALDNNYAIWNAFGNHYWPAHYFIDAEGRIRHHHFGEGEYAESERVIQQLLRERGSSLLPTQPAAVNAGGALAAADQEDRASPETYLGYARARGFASPGGGAADGIGRYRLPGQLKLNQWGLTGSWNVGAEHATLTAAPGSIAFRFHARDLHLVLGPAAAGRPLRFEVTLDGAPPGADHGMDSDAQGRGVVSDHRLYQLIRQQGGVRDRTFEIRFLDPGVQAFAFTFG
ncbi:MAG TPA: cytochrome c biogenesis protein DipZ [Burkholderiales bacterium]|nr:cytochrome c biogenesis protein DipZ [Burkholderiales bacterium]